MTAAAADPCGHRWPCATEPVEHRCDEPANHPTTTPCRCRCGATTTKELR